MQKYKTTVWYGFGNLSFIMKQLLVCIGLVCPLIFQGQAPQFQTVAITENSAFTFGEQLTYRVHYGPFNAATITMQVAPQPALIDGIKTWHIIGEGTTHAGYDWFFKVRDRYESYIRQDDMNPIKYVRKVEEGGYKDFETAKFDHKKGKIYSSKGLVETTDRSFQDVLSAIYYLRNVDFAKMKKGDKIYIKFYLDKILYSSMVTFQGKETIQTDIGTFSAIILKPKVVVDRVFPNEDAMTIWATDDGNLIPLRIKSELMVGSLKADITAMKGYKNPLTSKKKR